MNDSSMRMKLLTLANECELQAAKDRVAERKEAYQKVAEKLKELANGRYVNRLLFYGD